jgi:hypothetical protein
MAIEIIAVNHFTEIVMNLYHDMRKNITELEQNDYSLSQYVNKELFLFAEGWSPLTHYRSSSTY